MEEWNNVSIPYYFSLFYRIDSIPYLSSTTYKEENVSNPYSYFIVLILLFICSEYGIEYRFYSLFIYSLYYTSNCNNQYYTSNFDSPKVANSLVIENSVNYLYKASNYDTVKVAKCFLSENSDQ